MKRELSIPSPIYIVDAFALRPFTGNPAAVCLLTDPKDEGWLQQMANEMNLSETAFFKPLEEHGHFQLRWFTPKVEVDLCGHATLATAHVIWSTDLAEPEDTLFFHTRSGILTAKRAGNDIELDFPSQAASEAVIPAGLEEALGAKIIWFGMNKTDGLARLADAQAVSNLAPNMEALGKLPVRGLICTALGDTGSGYDFVSRFFAPAVGIAEDPATGSAHTALTPYWAHILGKKSMLAFQASERTAELKVTLTADGSRVLISGKAFSIIQGTVRA